MSNLNSAKVLVVDADKGFVAQASKCLGKELGLEVLVTSSFEAGQQMALEQGVDLVIAELMLPAQPFGGVELISRLRQDGFRGKAVIATRNSLFEPFFRAARAGAHGYWIKGPHLDLADEVRRILSLQGEETEVQWLPQKVESVGYFSSQGLTKREIELLSLFAEDFPRHNQLAARAGTKEGYIRRVFCRIYEKLNIDTMAQLAQLLTISAMYRYA